MVRNFVTGIVLGGVVAGAGLAIVSQIAPLGSEQAPEMAELATPEPAAADPGPEVTAPAPLPEIAATGAEAPPAAAADPQGLTAPEGEADEPLLRPMADDSPPPAAVVPDLTAPEPAVDAPTAETAPAAEAAGAAEVTPAEEPAAAEPAVSEQVAPELVEPEQVGGAEGAQSPASDAPALSEAPAATAPAAEGDAAASPATEPAATEPAVTEAPVAEAPVAEAPVAEAPVAEAPATEVPAMEAPATEAPSAEGSAEAGLAGVAEAPPSTLQPEGLLSEKTVEGVTTGRLPSIGAAETAEPADPAPEAAPLADGPPLRRFARAFENPTAKPLFAILLVDDGGPDVPRDDLAALPFPVSFVLDPMSPGAAAAAAIYRAAGQEVVMSATNIPKGATASDLEQSFAGIEGVLPEAVALIDTPVAAFQNDRKLAAEVVTLLADQGRGLVTYDRGLNAADQVARREGLASATIFRSLDDDGEDAPLIRRYLDRAAFKAAQEGEVAVIGTARAETITALMEWAVEGRAASVALAPVTALMAE